MVILKDSAVENLTFRMDDQNANPVTGISPTVTISKNGAGSVTPAGAVSEVGTGLYKVAAHATDSNTLGSLDLYAIDPAGNALPDRGNGPWQVVTADPRTNIAQTGDSFARIGAAGVSLTAVSLSAAGIQAIWDALTAVLITAGSIGKQLVDNINATISSRSTYAGGAVASVTSPVALTSAYDPAKTASQAGDAMALTAGERTTLTAVIWNALTAGFTTVASIGKLLVDNINATIASRSTYAGGAVASVTSAVALTAAYDAAKTASQAGDAMTLTAGERNSVADAYLDRADAIETSLTPRQFQRLMKAVIAGVAVESPAGTYTIKRADGTTTAVVVVHDTTGNRTSVTIGTL